MKERKKEIKKERKKERMSERKKERNKERKKEKRKKERKIRKIFPPLVLFLFLAQIFVSSKSFLSKKVESTDVLFIASINLIKLFFFVTDAPVK